MQPELVHTHEAAALFFARVFTGLLFFFQGIDSVFGMKIKGVENAFEQPLREKGIPKFIVVSGVYYTSYANLICGFLLIIGFVKYYAVYLLGINILLTAAAFSIIKPMWDLQFVFPRLALLIFFLAAPPHWDVLSVDYVWSLFKFIKTITN